MSSRENQTTASSPCRVDLFVSLAIVLVGLGFLAFGTLRYGLWSNNGPGAGLFPATAGAIAALCSGTTLLRKTRSELENVHWLDFSPFAAAGIAALLVPLIGMAESMTLLVLVWIRFIERRSWASTLISALIALAIAHLLFSVWLGVRFPDSLLSSLLTAGGN